jgi:hypothetical protein
MTSRFITTAVRTSNPTIFIDVSEELTVYIFAPKPWYTSCKVHNETRFISPSIQLWIRIREVLSSILSLYTSHDSFILDSFKCIYWIAVRRCML